MGALPLPHPTLDADTPTDPPRIFFHMTMNTTRALIVAVGASMLLPGCMFVKGLGTGRSGVVVERCHPSQYWDGTQCRHKGKGSGARKHDG